MQVLKPSDSQRSICELPSKFEALQVKQKI